MISTPRSGFLKFFSASALGSAALAAVLLTASVTDSSAQVLRRGLQGGLLGAGVGALIDGGDGALKGAAVGATIGAIVGATEREDYERRPLPPRRVAPVHDPELVYSIQTSLARLGYNPGPADGQYGPRTADAIRAYERNNQLPMTGYPSPALYDHLVARGG